MAANEYFPPVSELIPIEQLPDELDMLKDGLRQLFDHLYYRDLRSDQTPAGDAGRYDLKIVSWHPLSMEIPGTGGLALVLFPPTGTGNWTELPISLGYEWGILRYTSALSAQNIPSDPHDWLDLLIDVLGIDPEALLSEVIEVFVEAQDGLMGLVDDLEALGNGLNVDRRALEASSDPLPLLVTEIQNNNQDPVDLVFQAFIDSAGSAEAKLEQVFDLLKGWFGNMLEEDLWALIVPRAYGAIEGLRMALEFPREWLKPLDTQGQVDPNPDARARLGFQVGSVLFETPYGLSFQGAGSFDLPTAQIADTGLTLSLQNLELDLSRRTNIVAATRDARPPDFVGAFVQSVGIGLPTDWFEDSLNSSGELFGEHLLIGTGGFTGLVGLRERSAGGTPDPNPSLCFNLGSASGFRLCLDRFSLEFQQNAITGSDIAGSLTLPGFKNAQQQDAVVRISAHISEKGDFYVSAAEAAGIRAEILSVVALTIQTAAVGREEEDYFIEVSGELEFLAPVINDFLEGDIQVERLRIWSSGRMEIEGGTLPLPDSLSLRLGPAKFTVTAIHFGSHQREVTIRGAKYTRKYNYFGFDGGLNVDPGGVDARGDGIKFFYSVDELENSVPELDFETFIHIESLEIDVIIPGDADPSVAAAIINGFLSIKNDGQSPRYQGAVTFTLPTLFISGSAGMSYDPKGPFWLVDAALELPVPLLLGPTGLGIYGFRGLFGMGYAPERSAIGLTENDSWFQYYKTSPEGIHISKFASPPATTGRRKPFSVGAGASLGTAFDQGKVFSSQLFVLLRLPQFLLILSGKGNILGTRVGLTGGNPKFFMALAIDPDSVTTGFGISYKIPDGGEILDIFAGGEAGFFFNNPSAWYVNFGTKEKPNTATMVTIFKALAYLEMDRSGIEGGGIAKYDLDKSYAGGMVQVTIRAWAELGGRISFERPQIGGWGRVGGQLAASLLGFGFNFLLDIFASAEVPDPFIIRGGVELCVGVSLLFKRIEKCFRVEITWEINPPPPNRDAIRPFRLPRHQLESLIKGIHILTSRAFELHYFSGHTLAPSLPATNLPAISDAAFDDAIVPPDTYIDIEFLKGLLTSPAVRSRIGEYHGNPRGHLERIPPDKVGHQVLHEYGIEEINIYAATANGWAPYHPHEAMLPPSSLPQGNTPPGNLHVGFWQGSDPVGRNDRIRLLAQTPLSYIVDQSVTEAVPERYGITAARLFCTFDAHERSCVTWEQEDLDREYGADQWHSQESIVFRVNSTPARVIAYPTIHKVARSLAFQNHGSIDIRFAEECAEIELQLFSYAQGVTVRYYEEQVQGSNHRWRLVRTQNKSLTELLAPVRYQDHRRPVKRIEIVPRRASRARLNAVLRELMELERRLYETPNLSPAEKATLEREIDAKSAEAADLQAINCIPFNIGAEYLLGERRRLEEAIADCRARQAAETTVPINGSFEQGDLGFESLYQLSESGRPGTYSITSSASQINPRWKGRAFSKGRFMAVAGRKDRRDVVWRVKRTVKQGEKYVFRGWAASLVRGNPAELEVRLRASGAPESLVVSREVLLTSETGTWNGFQLEWEPAEDDTDLVVEIVSPMSRFGGVDFGLDDLDLRLSKPQPDCSELEAQLLGIKLLLELLSGGYQRPAGPMHCSTIIHRVCGLTITEHERREVDSTYPRAAVEAVHATAVAAINERLHPIWRPGTKFLIHFKLVDNVDRSPNHRGEWHHYFGFQTSGPVGYYEPDPMPQEEAERDDIARLQSLRDYIDYDRSYPDANGNLVSAKPLFFESASLFLAYRPSYTYHMFSDWPAYNGLPALQGQLRVVVKDPAEDTALTNPPTPGSQQTRVPEARVSWPSTDDPRIPDDVRTLMHMHDPQLLNPNWRGGRCWVEGGDPIRPARVHTQIGIDNLKPRKLYTAIFLNEFGGESREVHRYVFQTSRYPDFDTQVNSYRLTDNQGNFADAVFPVPVALTPAQIILMQDIVTGNLSQPNLDAAQVFADPFDRLMEHALRMPLLAPPVSTEINLIRNTATDQVVALLIRNPEPFNDPGIPGDILDRMLQVIVGGNTDPSYLMLRSRDASQVLILHTSGQIGPADLRFRFAYFEWNGGQYAERRVVTTTPINVA